MKRTLLGLMIAFSLGANAQNVNIPDANFKAYLVGNTAINTNGDAEIQLTEASAYTGQIVCSGMNISDMTGIDEFSSLSQLHCNGNSITALDVTANPNITQLTCASNQLTSLDVSLNTALTLLDCGSNQLTSLNISYNSALVELTFKNNSLSTIDIASNPLLENVNGENNNLTTFTKGTNNDLVFLYLINNSFVSIDISNLPSLYVASLMNSNLTSVNVSGCTSLVDLYVSGNALTTIDLSGVLSLGSLLCYDNNLTSLDVSFLPYLGELLCENNSLTSLNIKNGNNSNIATNYFKATGNANLTCIEVDDVTYSTTNWTNIDAGASFSLDCSGGVGIDELESEAVSVYPNPTSSQLTLQTVNKIAQVKIYNMLGALVQTESSKSFSVDQLPVGVYVIDITTNEGISHSRFVKE